MKFAWVAGVLVGILMICPATGHAADMGHGNAKVTLSLTKGYTASPWTSEVGYSNQALGKLKFGVKNLLLGWTEIFTEPKDASQKGENVAVGIGMGLKNAIEDELGGVVHLVTFLLPQVDAPLPQGGVSFS